MREMTFEEQKIAIAESLGWEPDRHFGDDLHWHKGTALVREVDEFPHWHDDYKEAISLIESVEDEFWPLLEYVGYEWYVRLHHRNSTIVVAAAANSYLALAICECYLKAKGLWK